MTPDLDFHAAKAMLLWQMELGADEAIGEAPVNRYAAAEAPVAPPSPAPVVAAAERGQVPERRRRSGG